MKFHAIAFTLLIVSASLAGCTADEALIVENETTNGCTVLLQIEETAKHSPGNTSWTNHTYDSNCVKINTTITGAFHPDDGAYQYLERSIDYDSSGNIAFQNTSYYYGSDEWGWDNFTIKLEYQYDANGNLLSIVEHPHFEGRYAFFSYENYSYDSSGREIMVTYESDRDNRTDWKNTTYDSNGLISKVTMVGIVDTPENITFHYDSNDLLSYTIASYEYSDVETVYTNYTYDSQERLIQVKTGLGDTEILTNTSYDATGQISEEIETWDGGWDYNDVEVNWKFVRTFTWDQIEIESETDTESDTESGDESSGK